MAVPVFPYRVNYYLTETKLIVLAGARILPLTDPDGNSVVFTGI